ncbi:MAG: primosomal protein N' [Burkholderiaceae bacterium]
MSNLTVAARYAQVVVDVPIAQPLDYRVPDDMVATVGLRCVVPFGRRKLVGVVVGLSSTSDLASERIKPMGAVLDEVAPLGEDWLTLTRFAADYYQQVWGEAALPALPAFFRALPGPRHAASLARMRKPPRAGADLPAVPRNTPNAEQAAAIAAITGAQGFSIFLLFGVTGSGKTEVYLNAIEQALGRDPLAQVLLLVPEINLTPQLEAHLTARFPGERVVSLHSGLAAGERASAWLAAHEGRARILVGTRMAVFASLPQLALVIVDEEHDPSFKAGDGVRYSARDLAIKLAQIRSIPVVLGSATPALETWARAKEGRYQRLTLERRAADQARLPQLVLVDTKVHAVTHGLAEPVRQALAATVARGEQAIVFLNRRGYAPVVACQSCGWLSTCPRCSVFSVFHKADRTLVCHHCGWNQKVPRACPTCGNVDLQAVGQGTQRIEEQLRETLPEARVLRIDRDSTRRKDSAQQAFESVHAGEVDVLVGTQMVAKGHDFQRVSLVVVLNADAQLVSHDFRAPERLFATLVQVAGRAGRAGLESQVLLQTRFPDHPMFAALAQQDYARFADAQLAERRGAAMPPYSHQALITAEAKALEEAIGFLQAAVAAGEALAHDQVRLYDPVPMSLMRLANVERAQLLVEADTRPALQAFLRLWLAGLRAERTKVRWAVEVDPQEV